MSSHFAILPQLGKDLVLLDRWSLLFSTLILGIGALIAIYAWQYFGDKKGRVKFYGAFFPFMAAMLGVVLFNHLVLIFICWELTSILSFFLISFKGAYAEARRGALHAALITGAGGLCLLSGILLLAGQGVWTIQELLASDFASLPNANWIAALFVLAAFTKSAQFPFHFWLPGAMAAPTPASGYLHSATMVKAGVYLLFRLSPVFESLDWFGQTLMLAGFCTFFLGAITSIFQMDLKAVLAGTTLANLGLMVALIGAPFDSARDAVVALVLAHALYKAGLFLFAGVVEHLAETRDLSRISGLGKVFPKTMWVGALLAGANLGLPFTLGYYAKGLMDVPLAWKLALMFGFTLLGKAGLLVAIRPFLGKVAGAPGAHAKTHPPGGMMIFGPALLGLLSWTLPSLSGSWAGGLELPTSPLFPSLSFSLFSALASCAISFYLAWMWQPSWVQWWNCNRFPNGARIFDEGWYGHLKFAGAITEFFQHGSLRVYLATIFGTFSLGLLFLVKIPAEGDIYSGDMFVLIAFLVVAKVAGTAMACFSRTPIYSVIFVGLVGYALSLTFALLNAPDLALTQFSVETLSVLLLVLVLKRIPDTSEKRFPLAATFFSIVCGGAIGTAVYGAALQASPSRLRNFFAETSWLEAHGRNVVNVILVDFRGLDTFGEITVLALAGFGIYLLLKGKIAQ